MCSGQSSAIDLSDFDNKNETDTANADLDIQLTDYYDSLNASLIEFSTGPWSSDADSLPDMDGLPLRSPILTSVDGAYQYLTSSNSDFPPIEHVSDDSLPIYRTTAKPSSNLSVPLSANVHITDSTSMKLELVHPIEETYRGRYKSDYFPQTGAVRRPRYVADRERNHHITLQVKSHSHDEVFQIYLVVKGIWVYHSDLASTYIRIALITVAIGEHGHFYSPYKFQKSHTDINVPDENPTYVKVDTNERDAFIMKLQLVLIKSKLDQLNYCQPLKCFSDTDSTKQNPIHESILSPKELINRYQLDKAHIAFTLCTQRSNGTYEIHPQTTVISTVISEVSTTKKTSSKVAPVEASATTASPLIDTDNHVCCPHCSHHFNASSDSTSDTSSKRSFDEAISCSSPKSTIKTNSKRRKKNE